MARRPARLQTELAFNNPEMNPPMAQNQSFLMRLLIARPINAEFLTSLI
jgi:hypothetical protein